MALKRINTERGPAYEQVVLHTERKKLLPDKVVTILWYVGYWAWLALFFRFTVYSDCEFGASVIMGGYALPAICIAPSIASRSSESRSNLLVASTLIMFLMVFFSLVITPLMLAFSENVEIEDMLEIGGFEVSVFTISMLECVRCAKKRNVPHTYARPAILVVTVVLYLCPIYVFSWLMDVLRGCDEFFLSMLIAIAALGAPCLIVGLIFYLIDEYIYPPSVR